MDEEVAVAWGDAPDIIHGTKRITWRVWRRLRDGPATSRVLSNDLMIERRSMSATLANMIRHGKVIQGEFLSKGQGYLYHAGDEPKKSKVSIVRRVAPLDVALIGWRGPVSGSLSGLL